MSSDEKKSATTLADEIFQKQIKICKEKNIDPYTTLEPKFDSRELTDEEENKIVDIMHDSIIKQISKFIELNPTHHCRYFYRPDYADKLMKKLEADGFRVSFEKFPRRHLDTDIENSMVEFKVGGYGFPLDFANGGISMGINVNHLLLVKWNSKVDEAVELVCNLVSNAGGSVLYVRQKLPANDSERNAFIDGLKLRVGSLTMYTDISEKIANREIPSDYYDSWMYGMDLNNLFVMSDEYCLISTSRFFRLIKK